MTFARMSESLVILSQFDPRRLELLPRPMLLNIPTEIQEVIILDAAIVSPASIASLSATCSLLRTLINIPLDGHLWRSIFLAFFDDPRQALSLESNTPVDKVVFNWQREAQRRFRAKFRLEQSHTAEIEEFEDIVDEDAVNALMETAINALPGQALNVSSKNETYVTECMRGVILSPPTTQSSAKLRVLAALVDARTSASLPILPLASASSRLPSRAYVYNMRNYNERNKWGPWLPFKDGSKDGEINYIHLWHIIDVLRHNAHERNNCDLPIDGIGGLRALSMPKQDLHVEKEEDTAKTKYNDWAGVEGVWMRTVSFMDYRDLHAYNWSNFDTEGGEGQLSTAVFEHENFAEAFRVIRAYFTVVRVEETGPPGYPHRPTIHFVGDTAIPNYPHDVSMHRITEGTVSMTEAGQVRWSFNTRVGGHEWSSEGVQLGRVQSRAGVVGIWSSADHEEHDPAGPFWLWKCGESTKRPSKFPGPFHYLIIHHDQ
ncbi:hypothetical protein PIIN_00604 [Serendipita indica DSM 11827]|uniref:F-box domain-containing protein n=1 Tax=Serendipita indica (strain DSM 11827) TaxID=1109443 RepID=G4T680_SERID|nr:hypothetical protein PIIN_00604 [Serendipita indica DSM 11827]